MRTPVILPVSKPKGPPLPIEIVQRIIDYAVLDFRASKDSSVLRALLHTSCRIRARVVAAFEPIRLQRSEVENEDSDYGDDTWCPPRSCKVDLPAAMFQYIEDMLRWVMFRDFSTRRFAGRSEPFAPRDDTVVRSTEGVDFMLAVCQILVKPDTVVLPSGKRSKKKDSPDQKKLGSGGGLMSYGTLNYNKVYGVLGEALRHKSGSFKARGLNPYQRLLGEASLDSPVSAGVLIELTLNFGCLFGLSEPFEQTWRWDTVPARDSKGKPMF